MEKHEACAAARSSSGLVSPPWASVRAAHVTARSEKRPVVPALTEPLPLRRSPDQVALAVRISAIGTSPRAGLAGLQDPGWCVREPWSHTRHRTSGTGLVS